MSDSVKLSSKLAKDDEFNGLDALADDMINNPHQVRVAVIYFDTVKVVTNTDEESEVPYARIRRFEPIGNVEDVSSELQNLIQQAVEARTGKAPLPFGTVDGIEVE